MMKSIIKTGLCALLAAGLWHSAAAEATPLGGESVSTPTVHLKAEYDFNLVFGMLDLSTPGMKKVKAAYNKGDIQKASEELLKYYRTRPEIKLPELNLDRVSNNAQEQKWADESLTHHFYAHKGYQSYFYGDDIDWRLWPVKDNELRWQLHRHYWFIPLAKAYYKTKDPKYVSAWIDHYGDWISKNPYVRLPKAKDNGPGEGEVVIEDATMMNEAAENARYAWRPLEVSRRLQDQITSFILTIDAPEFTPEFLVKFLYMFHMHADAVYNNYSEKGNHLLFEAQRMIYGGTYFHEFKDAHNWRASGIEILNREIDEQVYADGMQYELDPGYHQASINIFLKALDMATANGYGKEFPASYSRKVEDMIEVTYNMMFPDYIAPVFGDSKVNIKSSMISAFKGWSRAFPSNKQVKYFATEGKEGSKPPYLSKAFTVSGFYVFRDGWDNKSTVMIVKAGPPAFWHNQPDNGTFEIWRRGRNFFPDSGSYVYSGDEEVQKERAWFRQTKVHNTLTLDGRDIETTDSQLLLWDAKQNKLVTENQSYSNLSHRRSISMQDGIFIIVDEAVGDAEGEVAINFNMLESKPVFNEGALSVHTAFGDGNDIAIRTFAGKQATMKQQEGWVSYSYRKKEKRPAFAVASDKKKDEKIVFITVIAPYGSKEAPAIELYGGNIDPVKFNAYTVTGKEPVVNPTAETRHKPEYEGFRVKIGEKVYGVSF